MAAAAISPCCPTAACAGASEKVVPFVYAGAAILSPALFADAPKGEFSLTMLFDRAAEPDRLLGLRLDGVWMHVGTPDAVAAEKARPRQRSHGHLRLSAMPCSRSPAHRPLVS